MNHKAEATCPNGHRVEFGPCEAKKNKLFGGTKICGRKAYESISLDKVQCISCNTYFAYKTCPECSARIPVREFESKSFFSKLG